MEGSDRAPFGVLGRFRDVWVGVCVGVIVVNVLRIFSWMLSEIEGDGLFRSLVMVSRSVVRMCVRSSSARVFSFDTR
jgi:hypothetical protein